MAALSVADMILGHVRAGRARAKSDATLGGTAGARHGHAPLRARPRPIRSPARHATRAFTATWAPLAHHGRDRCGRSPCLAPATPCSDAAMCLAPGHGLVGRVSD